MKKIFLFALCAISTLSVFAEPYSKTKLSQIISKKTGNQTSYCYNSEISTESDYTHLYFALVHLNRNKGSNLTLDEINNFAKKFDGKIKNDDYLRAIGNAYLNNGHINQAQKINDKIKNDYLTSRLFRTYRSTNKEKMWKTGKSLLIKDGQGLANVNLANTTLTTMFRYKPKTVTKQQQIELLKQLSEIYPITGTDFAKWKGFMGFVGFKYKQLTGKDLF